MEEDGFPWKKKIIKVFRVLLRRAPVQKFEHLSSKETNPLKKAPPSGCRRNGALARPRPDTARLADGKHWGPPSQIRNQVASVTGLWTVW
jgi:hypothetical protein